jgi:hypothetical protein
MLTIEPHTEDNVVVGHAGGTLTHEDYQDFRGRVEQMIREHGSPRVLLDLSDFHGWDLRAAWVDLQLGLRHLGQFDRCAVLGDRGWQRLLVSLGKPFFRVRYFDRGEREAAWRWLMRPVERGEGANLLSAVGGFVRRHPAVCLAIAGGLAALLVSRLTVLRSRRLSLIGRA